MKKVVLASLLSLSACGAWAQAYGGVAVGPSHTNISCQGVDYCSDNDSGVKVWGGYQFTHLLGVEGAYIDFRNATGQQTVNGQVQTTTTETGAVAVGLTLRMDMGSVGSATARVGAAVVKSSTTTFLADASNQSSVESATRLSPYLGLGLAFPITPSLSATVAVDYTVADVIGGQSAGVRLVSFGLQYAF